MSRPLITDTNISVLIKVPTLTCHVCEARFYILGDGHTATFQATSFEVWQGHPVFSLMNRVTRRHLVMSAWDLGWAFTKGGVVAALADTADDMNALCPECAKLTPVVAEAFQQLESKETEGKK